VVVLEAECEGLHEENERLREGLERVQGQVGRAKRLVVNYGGCGGASCSCASASSSRGRSAKPPSQCQCPPLLLPH